MTKALSTNQPNNKNINLNPAISLELTIDKTNMLHKLLDAFEDISKDCMVYVEQFEQWIDFKYSILATADAEINYRKHMAQRIAEMSLERS